MIDKRGQWGRTPSHSLPRALNPHPCPCSPSEPLTALFSELSPEEILGRKALPPDEAGRERRREGSGRKERDKEKRTSIKLKGKIGREGGREEERKGGREGGSYVCSSTFSW